MRDERIEKEIKTKEMKRRWRDEEYTNEREVS